MSDSIAAASQRESKASDEAVPFAERGGEQDLVVAFVGAVVPDEPTFYNAAFSHAGRQYQDNLLRGLVAAGVTVSPVLSVRPMCAFPNGPLQWIRKGITRLHWGCEVVLLPFFNLPVVKQLSVGMSAALELFRLRARLGWARPIAVYSYNLSVPPIALVYIVSRLIRAKCVAALADIDVPGQTVPDTALYRLDFFLQKWFIPRLDGISVVAESMARNLGGTVPWIRVDGIVGEGFANYDRSRHGHLRQRNVFTIFAVGQMTPVNGIVLILAAFALLRDADYRLVIAGAGPLSREVLAAAASDARIDYRGTVSFEQLVDLYSEANVALSMRVTQSLDSRYGFPSKLIEAMVCGVPVVTTCIGHVEREFSNLVFLLKEETPEELAKILRRLREMPTTDREDVGRRARDYALTAMHWARQGQRLAKFLHTEVTDQRGKRPRAAAVELPGPQEQTSSGRTL